VRKDSLGCLDTLARYMRLLGSSALSMGGIWGAVSTRENHSVLSSLYRWYLSEVLCNQVIRDVAVELGYTSIKPVHIGRMSADRALEIMSANDLSELDLAHLISRKTLPRSVFTTTRKKAKDKGILLISETEQYSQY